MKFVCLGLTLWAASMVAGAGENDSPAFWLTQTIDGCTHLPTMKTISATQVELAAFKLEQTTTDHRISSSTSDVEGLRKWKSMLLGKARYLSLMEALSMGRIADYEYHLQWLVEYTASGQRIEQPLPLAQVYYLATLYGVSRPPVESVLSEISEYRSTVSEDSHSSAVDIKLFKTVEYLIGREESISDSRSDHWARILANIDAATSLKNVGKAKESLSVLDDVDRQIDQIMEDNSCTSPLVGAVHLRLASEYLDTLNAMAGAKSTRSSPNSQERQDKLLMLVDRTVSELSTVHYPELSSKAHLLLSSIYQDKSDESSGPVSAIYSKMSDRSKMISRDLTGG